MRVAIVTGASGQDGSYMCELLESKGYVVKPFVGDIRDVSNIEKVLSECTSYDTIEIYNLAAKIHHTNHSETLDINVMGIQNILQTVKESTLRDKCKIFHASSSEIFGDTLEYPQDENTPHQPRTIYGISKVTGQWLVKHFREKHGLFVCSGILYNHESPRRNPIFVTQKIVRGLKSGECFDIGNLESKRDWSHAKDCVSGMWHILQHDTPDDYIIATGKTHTVREFIETVVKHMDKTITWDGETGVIDGKVVIRVSKEFYRPEGGNILVGNPQKLESIGWTREYDLSGIIEDMLKV
jgi:GDPmannose 4,6-dehydratase